MNRYKMWIGFALIIGSSGCAAAVGTSGAFRVPADARTTCSNHCHTIGMRLGAVAIMANNVGCICDAGAASAQAVSPAVAAGMATIVAQEAARQQQQAHVAR